MPMTLSKMAPRPFVLTAPAPAPARHHDPPQSVRIAVKVKGKVVFVELREVIAAEADHNYVRLLCQGASILLRDSISAVAAKLENYGFIRIHRSVVVNGSLVDEIRPHPTGQYGLRMKGGKEFTVTRT